MLHNGIARSFNLCQIIINPSCIKWSVGVPMVVSSKYFFGNKFSIMVCLNANGINNKNLIDSKTPFIIFFPGLVNGFQRVHRSVYLYDIEDS